MYFNWSFAAGTLLLLWSGLLSAGSAETFIMPGKLIEGHARYEKKCASCHLRFHKGAQAMLCLDCHDKVAADIRHHRGFHGKSRKIRTNQCRTCHTEHIGRKGDIVKLDKHNFDHRQTDFVLRGRHRGLDCGLCHKPGKKYRAAPTDCYACHRKDDTHKTRLGRKCQTCHSEKGWKSTSFDHARTRFRLLGRHLKIGCISCHANARYKQTPRRCSACHAINDVHQGRLGKDCKACHSPKAWKMLRFDHARETDFPLTGRHRQLRCKDCHRKDPRKHKLDPACIACHRADDKHKGNFGERCGKCHRTGKWTRLGFAHDRDTKFPLSGRHARVDCADCHKKNPYRFTTSTQCYACHQVDDKHRGAQGKRCDKCHSPEGWRKGVRFDHGLTRFPLIGLHKVVDCKECHASKQYTDARTECVACHRSKDVHKRRLGTFCELCHTPNGWRIWRFDHARQTRFPLRGAHARLHCLACHRRPVRGRRLQLLQNCAACHAKDDPHDGRFGTVCDRCHSVSSFKKVAL